MILVSLGGEQSPLLTDGGDDAAILVICAVQRGQSFHSFLCDLVLGGRHTNVIWGRGKSMVEWREKKKGFYTHPTVKKQ